MLPIACKHSPSNSQREKLDEESVKSLGCKIQHHKQRANPVNEEMKSQESSICMNITWKPEKCWKHNNY